MKKTFLLAGMMAGLAFGAVSFTTAAQAGSLAKEDFSGTSLRFALEQDVFNITLKVSGPKGYHASEFIKNGSPKLNLTKHGKVRDGLYKYEITAALENEFVELNNTLDNGRGDNAKDKLNKSVYQNGKFHIVDGEITPIENLSEKEGQDSD